jgi:cyclophilin family peptidyl-prolyl cis-trans isomerase
MSLDKYPNVNTFMLMMTTVIFAAVLHMGTSYRIQNGPHHPTQTHAFRPGVPSVAHDERRDRDPMMNIGDQKNPGDLALGMTRREVGAAAAAVAGAASLSQIPFAAEARELASGSGSKVNKDPESLLRLGLPNLPNEIVELQLKLEETEDLVTRILLPNAANSVNDAKKALKKAPAILKKVPSESSAEATKLLESITEDLSSEELAKGDTDAKLEKIRNSLRSVTKIEEMIATTYKQPAPPSEFTKTIPWLKGRATVEFELKRPGGKFDVDGTIYDKISLTMVVDGYTSPITAGNFIDLVQRGFYKDFKIQRSDGFVVQTGDPSGEGSPSKSSKTGFVPSGSEEVRKVPLEVFVKGDKAPMYGATFDDDGRGGYAAVLPFNAYGALGMAREEYESDSASSQWFFLLFDSDLTPAGKNLLDGRYACFGYTVGNARLLADVKEGDVITSAKVTSGLENLVQPA